MFTLIKKIFLYLYIFANQFFDLNIQNLSVMKITKINMANVHNGKPFDTAQWRMATAQEKAKVYNTIASFNNQRQVIA